MTNMFDIFKEHGIEPPVFTDDEWEVYYANFYNVLFFPVEEQYALRLAVQDCIAMYQLRQKGWTGEKS